MLFPIQSRKYCRARIAYTITCILVIMHTLLNSHLLYGFVVASIKTVVPPPIKVCYHRNDSETYRNFFTIYDSYVDVIKTNVIPFIIMSICNIIIILRVFRSKSSHGNSRFNQKTKRKYEKDRQLTLMLVGSVIAFLLLTLPTEINDIIRSHSQDKVTEKIYLLSAILLSLAHLNYAVRKFLIYLLTNKQYHLFLGPFLYLYINR